LTSPAPNQIFRPLPHGTPKRSENMDDIVEAATLDLMLPMDLGNRIEHFASVVHFVDDRDDRLAKLEILWWAWVGTLEKEKGISLAGLGLCLHHEIEERWKRLSERFRFPSQK
jgi:hypothetical protein